MQIFSSMQRTDYFFVAYMPKVIFCSFVITKKKSAFLMHLIQVMFRFCTISRCPHKQPVVNCGPQRELATTIDYKKDYCRIALCVEIRIFKIVFSKGLKRESVISNYIVCTSQQIMFSHSCIQWVINILYLLPIEIRIFFNCQYFKLNLIEH